MNSPQDTVRADLILIHPPSVFDFRARRDVLFPYVFGDSVATSSMFEIYPLGFKSIEAYLERHGFSVRIVNLAALMLRKWDLDVRALLQTLTARVFGIDLHWIIHAHGALALAELLKATHPDVPTLFGGISSTLYAAELMEYDCVDMVLRGSDTHEPILQLMRAMSAGSGPTLDRIPNLLYRDSPKSKSKRENPFSHRPRTLDRDTAADWSGFLTSRKGTSPAMMILPSTGCAYNCGWCGGSRDATRRIMGSRWSVAMRPPEAITREVHSMSGSEATRRASIYTLNAYNFSRDAFEAYLKGVKSVGIRDVSYEQFHLTDKATLKEMVDAARTTINLSPESHDQRISRLAGRGDYSMAEMEAWIESALAMGVYSVVVWFFVGMPEQTRSSVFDTVMYCRSLMARFNSRRVVPVLTPMMPFLDPGSSYFEEPDKWGYRVFYRSLEEHRLALIHPSVVARLNYETRWLSREQLLQVAYDSIDEMTQAKAEAGLLPQGLARSLVERRKIEKDLIDRVSRLWEQEGTKGVIRTCGDEIRLFNENAFRSGVRDQIFPIPRSLDNRWFDEFEVK
jgi:clorobiocin biosynthesis protein CloN6